MTPRKNSVKAPLHSSNWAGRLRDTTRKLLGLSRPTRPIRKLPPKLRRPALSVELLEQRSAAGALTLSSDPLNFSEGVMDSSPVFLAGLTDSAGYATGPDYTITINWGDGSAPSQGYVYWTGNGYQIESGHTYTEEGAYTVTITVTDAQGNTASLQETAVVGDAALSADSNPTVNAVAGQPFDLPVGYFTDASAFGAASDFTTTIHWGDGGSSAGTLVQVSQGWGGTMFAVYGSHTYAAAGSYNITVGV
jgi:hypothetical protein